MSAWARLVNSDGSDEHLKLCEEALLEVQAEARRSVLDGLVRSLKQVREQRVASTASDARQHGEIWGLNVAILAIKRRIR